MRCIILSLNRACQLATLLESIHLFIGFELQIFVVYTATDEFFEEGYRKLIQAYPKVVFFREESNKRPLVLRKMEWRHWRNYWPYFKALSAGGSGNFKGLIMDLLESNLYKLIFFLTDNNLFISKPALYEDIMKLIVHEPYKHAFSFRHGINLLNAPKKVLYGYNTYFRCRLSLDNDFPSWKTRFDVNGFVYNNEALKKLAGMTFFWSADNLKPALNARAVHKGYFPDVYFSEKNSLTDFTRHPSPSLNGRYADIPVEKINRYFLKGYKLKYLFDEMQEFRPILKGIVFRNGIHQFKIKL